MKTLQEEWRTVPSAPTYQVSNFGQVRSKHKTLTPCLSSSGYKLVCMSVNKKRTTGYIHRLVAEAFIPTTGATTRLIVNHKNRDRLDNRIENLEWCTPMDNIDHWKTLNVLGDVAFFKEVLNTFATLPSHTRHQIRAEWKQVLLSYIQ